MKFVKMHGAGNDFIMLDGVSEKLDLEGFAQTAQRMCDRNFGIGGDGVIAVLPSRTASFKMRMFNPDGSESEMCGNGIRCFAKFIYDHKLTRETSVQVNTLAGVKGLKLTVEGGKVARVRVDMGSPELRRDLIPMKGPAEGDFVRETFRVAGRKLVGTCVSMGNPHCVIFVDNIDTFPVEKIGPEIEHHKLFPQRTNVPFAQVLSKGDLKVRVWERGAGETLACGTGACASAIAACLNEHTGRRVKVHLAGGVLEIEWTGDNIVMMDGPAEEVFSGDFPL